MQTVFIVQGVHFSHPGAPMTVHATKALANQEAASLVNSLLEWVELPQNARSDNWKSCLQRARKARAKQMDCDIDDLEEDGGDVWIEALPVAGTDDKRDPAVWLERATDLLSETLGKWESEEESVQEEKADHIAELNKFFKDWEANKPTPVTDELTRQIARMRPYKGRNIDVEDAVDTVNSLIKQARKAVAA